MNYREATKLKVGDIISISEVGYHRDMVEITKIVVAEKDVFVQCAARWPGSIRSWHHHRNIIDKRRYRMV